MENMLPSLLPLSPPPWGGGGVEMGFPPGPAEESAALGAGRWAAS